MLPVLLLLLVAAVPSGARSGFGRGSAGVGRVRLEVEPGGPQRVGTTLTLRAAEPREERRDYRFSVQRIGDAPRVVSDYSPVEELHWTPLEAGIYLLRLDARDAGSGEVERAWRVHFARAPERPAVLATRHPLVAVYTARANRELPWRVRLRCRFGPGRCALRVVAAALEASHQVTTPPQPLARGRATTVCVAGLRESTTYALHHEILAPDGRLLDTGPVLYHETGEAALDPPQLYVFPLRRDAPNPAPLLLTSPALGPIQAPYAVDREGHLVWYDPGGATAVGTRIVAGGSFLEIVRDAQASMELQIVREIDLVGSVVRQTTLGRINEQLASRGEDLTQGVHHEVRRLPGGATALLAYVVRDVPIAGFPFVRRVLGDMIVVLDRDLQVTWTWNAFDHLDTGRRAILDELCTRDQPGCPAIESGDVFEDWLHSNGIAYSPGDGALLLSVRNQDWIVKIDYGDGSGSGEVLWRLGAGGDFELESDEPLPWFSHPHDANLLEDGRLILYDNGNTRCNLYGQCNSRAQVYELDEESMTARLPLSIRLQAYSPGFGSALPMEGGNLHFNTGLRLPTSRGDEYVSDGGFVESISQATPVYRSFRLRDLYTPPPVAGSRACDRRQSSCSSRKPR